MSGIYTVAEIEQEIRDIQDDLKALRKLPTQQSIDGNFVSFLGKAGELRKELKGWKAELKAARSREAGSNAAQGPCFEV